MSSMLNSLNRFIRSFGNEHECPACPKVCKKILIAFFFIEFFLLQTLYKTDRRAPDYLITSILLTTFLTEKGTVSKQNKIYSFDLLIVKWLFAR